MARMVYIRQIDEHTFLHFTTSGSSFRLRDYSRSPLSPPREVKRQKRDKPSLSADDIRAMAELPGNYNLEPPESGRDRKDLEFWHKTTIQYNQKYLMHYESEACLFDWSKFDPAMVKSDGRPSLVEELTTYRDRLPELLQHEGAYVVIKGKSYKILPDREAALQYAMEQYWPVPVLVKKIVDKETLNSLGGAVL